MKCFLKIFIVAFCAAMSLASCSKEKLEQLAVDNGLAIMTDGSWLVTKYSEGATDITSSFTGWECHFNADKTAIATKGPTSVTGSWTVSLTNKTISSKFPEGSGVLEKINGTWQIVKSNSTYGEFSQTINGVNYTMELTKK